MSSFPHSRTSLASAILLAAGLVVSGCATTGDADLAVAEREPIVIATDEPILYERVGDVVPTASGETTDSTDKIIVRRPVDRFALDLGTLDLSADESRTFGGVDFDVLEEAAGSPVKYAVHTSALSVKSGKNGRSLRQRFDPATNGSPRVEFAASIPDADDESWLSYKVYFEPRFEWNKGGKLPGLAGGSHPTFEGGDGTDGFSARIAWMPDGQMGVYLYHPDRPDELGELRPTFGTFKRKQWQEVTQRVVMNSAGQSDGILQVWLDDLLVFSDTNMTWRTTGDFGADVFLYSAFYGGGSVDWAPETTNYVRFADISVATTDDTLTTLSR